VTKPVPYEEYESGAVRRAMDSLPLSAEGLRIYVGVSCTFIVRMDSFTGGRTMLTAKVRAVTSDRVYFSTDLKDIHKVSDGIEGHRCYLVRDNAVAAFEKEDQRLDKTA
jgi:hypothetical protein